MAWSRSWMSFKTSSGETLGATLVKEGRCLVPRGDMECQNLGAWAAAISRAGEGPQIVTRPVTQSTMPARYTIITGTFDSHQKMRNLAVGLVGAIVGGFLFEKLKLEVVPDFWGNLITATVGAVVFLLIWRAIRSA